MKFKMATSPFWIYHFCPFWSNCLFPVAAVYITAKFHSSRAYVNRRLSYWCLCKNPRWWLSPSLIIIL